MDLNPPKIQVAEYPLETDKEQFELSATVVSAHSLQDLMVYVNQQKVFFLSHQEMSNNHQQSFKTSIPLKEKVNRISIYARENSNSVSHQMIIINRPNAPEDEKRSTSH